MRIFIAHNLQNILEQHELMRADHTAPITSSTAQLVQKILDKKHWPKKANLSASIFYLLPRAHFKCIANVLRISLVCFFTYCKNNNTISTITRDLSEISQNFCDFDRVAVQRKINIFLIRSKWFNKKFASTINAGISCLLMAKFSKWNNSSCCFNSIIWITLGLLKKQ